MRQLDQNCLGELNCCCSQKLVAGQPKACCCHRKAPNQSVQSPQPGIHLLDTFTAALDENSNCCISLHEILRITLPDQLRSDKISYTPHSFLLPYLSVWAKACLQTTELQTFETTDVGPPLFENSGCKYLSFICSYLI